MIELISLITLSCIVAVQLVFIVLYRIKYLKMIKVIAQLILDKEVLADKLDRTILENSKEVNEGFIKFLSDSRQAAFDYIEDVQKAVQNYLTATHNGNNDEIVTARMELFSYLPEDAESQDKNQG